MYQPSRDSGRRATIGVAEPGQPGPRDPQQVAAEVEEHGCERAELRDGGESRARVFPAGKRRDDAQMGGARDRQELGEPLHDAKHDRLEQAQFGRSRQPRPSASERLASQFTWVRSSVGA